MFIGYEIPVANSVMNFLGKHNTVSNIRDPITNYTLLWIAFNNIYFTLAKQNKLISKVQKDKDGKIKMDKIGNVEIPKVTIVGERKQIKNAHKKFSDSLKHDLIVHENTYFFVYRKPKWRGQEIEFDKKGQKLNGVINVAYTTSSKLPVWSPIEIDKFEQYINNKGNSDSHRNDLSKQILFVLYTIRNNTFHGGKRMDDDNDIEVVEKATSLLHLIVSSFFQYENIYH